MGEDIQYGGGISSIKWKIFSTDVSHHKYISMEEVINSTVEDMQYGPVTSSLQRRVCSTWLPKLLKV